VSPTLLDHRVMSAFGPWRTFVLHCRMSAFGGKADMTFCGAHVGF
jgi:hypothetical protein